MQKQNTYPNNFNIYKKPFAKGKGWRMSCQRRHFTYKGWHFDQEE